MTMLGVYQWPGYHEFRRQVQIRDETPTKNPITIAKFAHHIGRSVEAFLRVSLLCWPVTNVCTQPTWITLRCDHNRILRQVKLKGRNLVAGLSDKVVSTLLTLGSLELYTFPPVAGCQSFSLMTSGFFNALPQLGMITTSDLSLVFRCPFGNLERTYIYVLYQSVYEPIRRMASRIPYLVLYNCYFVVRRIISILYDNRKMICW